jgi:hypothetical protein
MRLRSRNSEGFLAGPESQRRKPSIAGRLERGPPRARLQSGSRSLAEGAGRAFLYDPAEPGGGLRLEA